MEVHLAFPGAGHPDPQPVPRRRKRAQVARACGSCRLRRIKCDNNVPCSNCVMNGGDCSKKSAPSAFTLSQAHQEIASLRQKVSQLESELQNRSEASTGSVSSVRLDTRSPSVTFPAVSSEAAVLIQNGASAPRQYWGGVHFCPARSPNSLWLGPSSLYAFTQRLSSFLGVKLNQEHPPHQMLPISASDNKLLDRPAMTGSDPFAPTSGIASNGVYLSPLQEEYFLNYFWQTYHVAVCPILDEAQFKQHYQSLLIAGGKERRPSALVDIVVAACMQYHISTLPLGSQGVLVEGKDALVAGRWHYWRGQTLLTYELESPSISTLQCHLLCAIYLCGGSFHNLMDTAMALAVRTAYILGLHLDPPPTLPEAEREMRRRLWWCVYFMDSRANMKLGRPFMLSESHAMPALPSDSLAVAAMSGSTFVPAAEDTTWLSFNLHQITLYRTIRAAYTSFYNTDFHLQEGQTIWDRPDALQAGAQIHAQHTQHLDAWCESIPDALRLKRQDANSRPFATDSARVVFEQFAPQWLQRQRVVLEHTYHHVCVNLFRPMICFTHQNANPTQGSGVSLPDELATRCAIHAIAVTKLTHQVLEETSLFDGWHEAFYCQWNAVMTLIGFVMAYPNSNTTTSEAKSAIRLAIAVFDNFGVKFAVAASASKIVQGLCAKIETLAANERTLGFVGDGVNQNASMGEYPPPFGGDAMSWDLPNLGGSYPSGGNIGHSELDLLDMAFDIDFWNKVDMLWPGDIEVPI
ncbi:fungal-specific transcription factor domain-containing protein [Aspergillus carlsbadensis]|nr:fungal-specific transcription factor domain-containing protein [Aspergillus carlsbadensis]